MKKWKEGKMEFPHKCPVCGKYDFVRPFEDCPVCDWCNDVVQEEHPDWERCANSMSLNLAKAAYSKRRFNMNTIVIYKSKYGGTKKYAEWIAEELGCSAIDAKTVKIEDILKYDTIIYGGGLYAEVINGVHMLVKNMDKLKDKKVAVFTTGITPIDCRDYYDKMVIEKNFKEGLGKNVRVFNYLGKMVIDELSLVHRTALKTLKKIMQGKENPSDMEKLLVELCDADGDFCDRESIRELLEYVRG